MGGIGMSGIARVYLSMGYEVQGSDLKKNEILSALEAMGAKVLIGHDASYVSGADLVVYSSSIAENHPERAAAVKERLELIHRAEALARICEGKFTVAVTGTHGKTTTTALIGMALKEAGHDPSVVVGGVVNFFGGNACVGNGKEIVIEADESDSSFLKFSPDLEVITNIEDEHMDHFGTAQKVEETYRNFIRRLPPGAVWVGCAEDDKILRLASENIRPALLYGFDKNRASVYAEDIVECPGGRRGVSFKAFYEGKYLGLVHMKIIGHHNVLNALAVIGVSLKLGIPFEAVARGLGKYEGAGRRFDIRYEDDRFLIVDDYAHHPTEIRKTLQAARSLGSKRILAVFQPHRYTRVESLMEEFAKSFEAADQVIVTDIYAAGEMPRAGVTGERVNELTRKTGHKGTSFVPRREIKDYLLREMKPGDLVITLGAGDITHLSHEIADFLSAGQAGAGRLLGEVGGRVSRDEPLSRHTTLKVGGAVDFWIEPEDPEDLKKALKVCHENVFKIYIFGFGSNILPPDEGLRGAAIHLGAAFFKKIRIEKGRVIAGASAPNTLFIQHALEHGLGGCEFLLGIPGSVGGAVAMNAGSHGQSIDAFIETVTLVDFTGRERILKKEEIPFSYRFSGIRDSVIVETSFLLPKREKSESQRTLDQYRDHRIKTQDLKHPSAGCMFKNPKDFGYSSGQLIEQAGFKGKRVGGAQVSSIHANFIVNLGGATSGDILTLIREIKSSVKQKFGVELETEVKIL